MYQLWDTNLRKIVWIHILISVAISVVYQFSAFFDNPEFNKEFLFLLVIKGGLNAKSRNCCNCNKISIEGSKLDGTNLSELQQLIHETTQKLKNSTSCIDLIFISQPSSPFTVSRLL